VPQRRPAAAEDGAVDFTPGKTVVLLAVGLLAGVVGGMLGVGGSIVFIPALGQLFPEVGYGVYAAAALVCNVFVGLGSVVGHWRQRRIIAQVVKLILPLGAAAAVLGVLAANALERLKLDKLLWAVFGAVIAYMLYDNMRRLFERRERAAMSADAELDPRKVNLLRAVPVAVPTGFLGGLLGIGGGVFSVPSQELFLHMPQKNAIANSSTTIVVFSAIAALVKNLTVALPAGLSHWHPLLLAGVLVPPAVVGALIGSRLTHALPDRLVRGLFAAFLAWTVYQCFFQKVNLPELLRGGLGA